MCDLPESTLERAGIKPERLKQPGIWQTSWATKDIGRQVGKIKLRTIANCFCHHMVAASYHHLGCNLLKAKNKSWLCDPFGFGASCILLHKPKALGMKPLPCRWTAHFQPVLWRVSALQKGFSSLCPASTRIRERPPSVSCWATASWPHNVSKSLQVKLSTQETC